MARKWVWIYVSAFLPSLVFVFWANLVGAMPPKVRDPFSIERISVAADVSQGNGNSDASPIGPGSPAIDRIPVASCTDALGNPIATDQRGVNRPQGAACDTGAHEAASLTLHQDPADGATGLKISVTQVTAPATGAAPNTRLGGFKSQLTYRTASGNPSYPAESRCINILGIREMDFTIAGENITNGVTGSATFNGFSAEGVVPPADLGHALTRLTGSATMPCPLTREIPDLTDVDGNTLLVEPPQLGMEFLRGDARADRMVNIADALFIAQYLVGLRPACTEAADVTCVHSVNAASVRHDGAFDRKTIADALFIAQNLVGSRDRFFNLAPSPDVVSELDKEFRLGIGNTAILESENLRLTFLEVSEDSRCPSDVVCVWEGQATAVVDLSVRGQRLGSFDLTLRAGSQELATQQAGGYRLTLVGLEPYPISTHQIQPQEYQATFVIHKAE